MSKLISRQASISVLFLFLISTFPETVLGHSIVIEKNPSPHTQLEEAPGEVSITFNRSVEKDLSSIKVTNTDGEEMTTSPLLLSEDQKRISIALPELEGGIYTVEYYVVSSNDGHPVRGSYQFQVNKSAVKAPNTEAEIDQPPILPEETPDHEIIPDTKDQYQWNIADIIMFFLRMIYYLGLLLLIGWVFWWRTIRNYTEEFRKKYLFWGTIIQMLHLVGLLSMILVQLDMFTANGLSLSHDFLVSTNIGLMWFVSLFLSLIGFISLFRNPWWDIFWVISIVLAKSMNGHAMEFEQTTFLVVSNGIHLFAASLWAAGIFLLIISWRKQRLLAQAFLPIFSRMALITIIILSASGIFATFSIFEQTDYLLTTWSLFLWTKIIVVVTIMITGGMIRFRIKRNQKDNVGMMLKVDFILMITIVILISIITYLNPQL